jgi:GNAT superfamily N-acetyltransferase
MTDATLRPLDPGDDGDRRARWRQKRAFETELGSGTGDEAKAATYETKLTDDHRRRWLAWVERCVDDDDRCLTLARADGEGAGYVFVLPERLSFVWDAAVLNELYVAPDHRGTGVADALLEAAVGVAEGQDLPLDRLLLDVDPGNGRASAFYERHGFEPWGEIVAREL